MAAWLHRVTMGDKRELFALWLAVMVALVVYHLRHRAWLRTHPPTVRWVGMTLGEQQIGGPMFLTSNGLVGFEWQTNVNKQNGHIEAVPILTTNW